MTRFGWCTSTSNAPNRLIKRPGGGFTAACNGTVDGARCLRVGPGGLGARLCPGRCVGCRDLARLVHQRHPGPPL
eukprot:11175949-Lingulodinium_polyedra.AAC.1